MNKLWAIAILVTPSVPGAQEIANELVGTWELESVEELDASGRWVPSDRLGIEPSGFIVYDSAGNVMVQIMGKDRPLLPEVDPDAPYDRRSGIESATRDQLGEIVRDYVAYFGPYEVNSEDQSVIHRRRGHLVPNVVGEDAKRFFSVDGNTLTLIHPGGAARRTWRRATK